jgi:hypothetical protein
MSTTVTARPQVGSTSAAQPDSPEDIAEMMAEAARVDALFQSMAISTLLSSALTDFLAASMSPDHSPEPAGSHTTPGSVPTS